LAACLKQLFDADCAYNPTAVEGNTFSLQETKVLLLETIAVGGNSTLPRLEIMNCKEAIAYIEALSHRKTEE
jgi:hypothetical protein